MWELDRKEGWVPKNWCFWTMVLEKTLESPMDCKEIKPANPEGHQPWIFMGRTDTEAPILWPPDAKSQLIGKDPDGGKDWGQEEKRVTEDEMIGYHHWLSGHVFDQTSGNNEVQGSLACCSPWVHKEVDMTDNWTTTLPYNNWVDSRAFALIQKNSWSKEPNTNLNCEDVKFYTIKFTLYNKKKI